MASNTEQVNEEEQSALRIDRKRDKSIPQHSNLRSIREHLTGTYKYSYFAGGAILILLFLFFFPKDQNTPLTDQNTQVKHQKKRVNALKNLKKSVIEYGEAMTKEDYPKMVSYMVPKAVEQAGGAKQMIEIMKAMFPLFESSMGMNINWNEYEYKIPKSFIQNNESEWGCVITTKTPFIMDNQKGAIYGSEIALSFDQGKTWFMVSGSQSGRAQLTNDYPGLYQKLNLPDNLIEVGGNKTKIEEFKITTEKNDFLSAIKKQITIPEEVDDLETLSANTLNCVGTVMTKIEGEFVAIGSGFMISEDGQFVTNWHVVEGNKRFMIKMANGVSYNVTDLLYSQPDRDLAILKVYGSNFNKLSIQEGVTVGERILVVGSPQGLGGSVTDGIVSATRNFSDLNIGDDYANNTQCVQVTAPISPGSSGSPIISLKSGAVVAIASFKRNGGQSLNFGVSSKHLNGLLESKNKTALPPINNNLKEPVNSWEAKWANSTAYNKFIRLTNDAIAQHNYGNYEKALQLYLEASDLAKENVGERHIDYADILIRLSSGYRSVKQFDSAYTYLTIVRKLIEQGIVSSYVLYQYNFAVARYYNYALKDTKKTIDFYRKALEIAIKELNTFVGYQASTTWNLAEVYFFEKDYDQAIGSYKSFFVLVDKMEGIPERDLYYQYALSVNHEFYGRSLYAKKKYKDAIFQFKKAGQLYRKYNGETSESVAKVYSLLAYCYDALGDLGNENKYMRLAGLVRKRLKKPD
ncbi:tetratricopeptide repeat-containing serine protease family protein [Verrucomicrobia bacterium]|nr:tetratricopeptide repeat-containing serine protease family protein [Verrucomicrobiota bacterium]